LSGSEVRGDEVKIRALFPVLWEENRWPRSPPRTRLKRGKKKKNEVSKRQACQLNCVGGKEWVLREKGSHQRRLD